MRGKMVLLIPDLNGKFVMETDASSIGLSAVLFQDTKFVGCISRCLSSAEKNYFITEKKVLTVLWAMENSNIICEVKI